MKKTVSVIILLCIILCFGYAQPLPLVPGQTIQETTKKETTMKTTENKQTQNKETTSGTTNEKNTNEKNSNQEAKAAINTNDNLEKQVREEYENYFTKEKQTDKLENEIQLLAKINEYNASGKGYRIKNMISSDALRSLKNSQTSKLIDAKILDQKEVSQLSTLAAKDAVFGIDFSYGQPYSENLDTFIN